MANGDKGFLFFYDWIEPFKELSGDDFKRLFLAMVDYQQNDVKPPEFHGKSRTLSQFVFPQLSRRKANTKAGKAGAVMRWENNANSGANSDANGDANTQDKDKDKNIDIDSDKTTPRASETASRRRGASRSPIEKKQKSYDLEEFFKASLNRGWE